MIAMVFRVALVVASVLAAPLARADEATGLAAAQRLAEAGDWDRAGATARAAGSLAGDIVEWQRLRAGKGAAADYLAFVTGRADWPGLALLRREGEAAFDGAPAATVLAYFDGAKPQTGTGSLALIAALLARGDQAAARAEAVRAWRGLALTEAEQARFLAGYGTLLADHHDGRIAAMLRAGNLADARRMLALASPYTRSVAEARIALQADDKGIDGLIAALPDKAAGSGGLAYDRFRWRIRKDLYDSAGDLLLERSSSAESLGDPAQWAEWRRRLARREMREGDPARAYRMAARHHLGGGSDYADLEWLAGYIALRKLGDAKTALVHFDRFAAAVATPVSLSRAGYWRGRAHEALGQGAAAKAAYAEGARYQSAFYGLLSAEKVGLPLSPALAGREGYPDWNGAAFTRSSVFQAALLLREAGARDLARRFLSHLAEGLSGEDTGRLAGLALGWKEPHLALVMAKAAAEKGAIWPRAYFPLNGLEAMDLPVAPELALAIARRESEFDPAVVSSAGARGLMQVMPGTAQMMARKVGLGYEAGKLTRDWAYNARLGAAYLADLVAEFGPSPLLVAAGYNAGPGRSRQWIAALGDPRSDRVDPVDWIEHIPFQETQTYVMRVAESLPIYRARLSGQTGPLRFTDELRGR